MIPPRPGAQEGNVREALDYFELTLESLGASSASSMERPAASSASTNTACKGYTYSEEPSEK